MYMRWNVRIRTSALKKGAGMRGRRRLREPMGDRSFRRFSFRGRSRRRAANAPEVDPRPVDSLSEPGLFEAAFAGRELVIAAGRYLEWVDTLPGLDDPTDRAR
jgi:hypothetical protein